MHATTPAQTTGQIKVLRMKAGTMQAHLAGDCALAGAVLRHGQREHAAADSQPQRRKEDAKGHIEAAVAARPSVQHRLRLAGLGGGRSLAGILRVR
jgi:hypothetical protein